jgi:hypothetical protein
VGQSYHAIQTNAQDATKRALPVLSQLIEAYHFETNPRDKTLYLQLFLELAKTIIQKRKNIAKVIFEACKKLLLSCHKVEEAYGVIQEFDDKELLVHLPATTLWIDYCEQTLMEQGTLLAVVAWKVATTLQNFYKINFGSHRKFLLPFLEKLYQSDDKEAQQVAEQIYAGLSACRSFEIDPKLGAPKSEKYKMISKIIMHGASWAVHSKL